MDKRQHQFMTYLHYVKDFCLYHLSPQMISIEEIALQFLDFLQIEPLKPSFHWKMINYLPELKG